jgi:hypothetical protein
MMIRRLIVPLTVAAVALHASQANAAKCGIPPQGADQVRAAHKNIAANQKKGCVVTQRAQGREPARPVGGFDDVGEPPLYGGLLEGSGQRSKPRD